MLKAGLYASGVSALLFASYSHFLEENPLTHKRRFMLWRASIDSRIGKFASDLEKAKRKGQVIPQSSPTHQVVYDISKELLQRLPKTEPRNWNVTVVRDSQPNAFAIPDGSIFVTTKLIEMTDVSDELGLVLAHEIGHVYLRHSAHQMSTTLSISVLLSLCQFLIFGETYSVIEKMQALMLTLPMSRQHETEADQFAVRMASETGFDNNKGPAILGKLKKLHPKEVPWLSTHPATDDRLKELKLEVMRLKDQSWPEDQIAKRKRLKHLDSLLAKAKTELAKMPKDGDIEEKEEDE